MFQHTAARRRLGRSSIVGMREKQSFNTQPPEGGWLVLDEFGAGNLSVSTHSRPKAAGISEAVQVLFGRVSTHSRPKAAGASV